MKCSTSMGFVCAILSVTVLVLSATAEYRIWTDKKGNEIEAEFIREFGGKLTLRDRKGRVFKVDPKGLSEADHLYLNPPPPPPTVEDQYEIQLRKRTWSGKSKELVFSRNFIQDVEYEASMVVNKKQEDAPDLEGARGFVFICGHQIENDTIPEQYIVIDRYEVPLEWEDGKGLAQEGSVITTLVRDEKGKLVAGIKYRGHAIALISKDGEVMLTQQSSSFLDDIEKLRALNREDLFNKKLEKVKVNK